jgi:hypothetical protein
MSQENDHEAENEPVVTPTCRRKVKYKSKVKICGDATGDSTCGTCSNHCRNSRCEVHG